MLAVVRDPTESRLKTVGEDTPGETLVKIVSPGKNWPTAGGFYFSLKKNDTPGEKSTNRWCKAEKVMGGGGTLPRGRNTDDYGISSNAKNKLKTLGGELR